MRTNRNTVHLAAFSREAAQDRSPGWSEAKAWVRTARRQPRKGCRKTTSRFRRWIEPSCAEEIQRLGSSDPRPSATQASSPASLSTKDSAPAKKHPQPPRNVTVSGTFQPENSPNKGNTYYSRNHQTTHSYTTYGNTRGTEKGKIAKPLSYSDIFCHNTT